jgi:hypothetical protein
MTGKPVRWPSLRAKVLLPDPGWPTTITRCIEDPSHYASCISGGGDFTLMPISINNKRSGIRPEGRAAQNQAAKRFWRIRQKQAVHVIFIGYVKNSQIACLELMAKKFAVSRSNSGDAPESRFDSLDQDSDSVDMALVRQLVAG